MNIPPIVWVKGRVRRVQTRHVDAYAGRVGGEDPNTGEYISPAPARPAYDVEDVTVDTEPGGLITVGFTPEAMKAMGTGEVPEVGADVELPVRVTDLWLGKRRRRYRTTGYFLAGEVEGIVLKRDGGRARALASTGS